MDLIRALMVFLILLSVWVVIHLIRTALETCHHEWVYRRTTYRRPWFGGQTCVVIHEDCALCGAKRRRR